MSRWSIDPPDDDAYDVRYDGTDCADCGRPSVAWLCETCSDQRDAHTSALELRLTSIAVSMVQAALEQKTVQIGTENVPAVVDVALVPVFPNRYNPVVVEVALVPVDEVRELKRMATAILSADLTQIKEVA